MNKNIKTMKTYTKPECLVVDFYTEQGVMNLTSFDDEKGKGTLHDEGATGEAMTRKHGIGAGLWEDMK